MPFPPIQNFNPDFLAVLAAHNNDYDAAVQSIVTDHKSASGLQEFSSLVAAAHNGFLDLLILQGSNPVKAVLDYFQQHNQAAFQALNQPKQGYTQSQNARLVVATMAEAQIGFINKAIVAAM